MCRAGLVWAWWLLVWVVWVVCVATLAASAGSARASLHDAALHDAAADAGCEPPAPAPPALGRWSCVAVRHEQRTNDSDPSLNVTCQEEDSSLNPSELPDNIVKSSDAVDTASTRSSGRVAACAPSAPGRSAAAAAASLQRAVAAAAATQLPLSPESLHIRNAASMTSIPREALAALPALQVFSVHGANIKRLGHADWQGLQRLTQLHLVDGALEVLPPHAFRGLNLTELTLRRNKISVVEDDAFATLSRLRHMDLSRNVVRRLAAGALLPTAVEDLDLAHNQLRALPTGLFTGLPHLLQLEIFDNRHALTIESRAFADLPSLTYLDLHSSGISSLPPDAFRNSSALVYLDLSANRLVDLHQDLFQHQILLQTLKLSRNKLEAIPDALFRNMRELNLLELDGNKITELPGKIFMGCSSFMRILSLSDNLIHNIDPKAFEGINIIWFLNLDGNQITFKSDGSGSQNRSLALSPLHNMTMISYLNLSRNSIDTIFPDWQDNIFIQELDLSYNHITELKDADQRFKVGTKVYLQHNDITVLERRTADNFGRFLLEYNPFNCDCRLAHYLREPNYYNYLNNATCAQPQHLRGSLLTSLDLRAFACT